MKWEQGKQRRARKAWRKAHKGQGPMLAGESPRPKKTLVLRDLARRGPRFLPPEFYDEAKRRAAEGMADDAERGGGIRRALGLRP